MAKKERIFPDLGAEKSDRPMITVGKKISSTPTPPPDKSKPKK